MQHKLMNKRFPHYFATCICVNGVKLLDLLKDFIVYTVLSLLGDSMLRGESVTVS